MRARTKLLYAVAACLFVGFVSVGLWVTRHGFSAKEKPSRLEEFFARHARKIATPADAKRLKDPYPSTLESLRAARAHWVDHCASCHGLDGRGKTMLGLNLYPKAPDLRDAATQGLSDGELYYIINNGIRFTGMPAWGSTHSREEMWQLVSFVRRLPDLTPDELKAMEQMAAGETVGDTDEAHPHSHSHGSETEPHSHHH